MTERTVQDLLSLQGKAALMTGASGYLGSAMARGLAEAGARVIVTSRHRARAELAARELPEVSSGPHLAVELDHLNEESIQHGFAEAVQLAGQVDVVVNNGHDPLGSDWSTVNAAQFRRQLDNLTGYFLLSRMFHDHVKARCSQGSLVLIGSMYGVVGSYPDVYEGIGAANPVAYQALKGGIIQMTRHLAVYWAADGLRVNCLSPGPFPNPDAPGELVGRIAARTPLRRIGIPEELKGAIVFLASDASSYLTGQNLIIDGGWTAW